MAYLSKIAKQLLATLRQMRSDDPLLHPLGRAPDRSIDAALAARGLARADLFEPEGNVAPHRHRIIAMLSAQGLPSNHVTAHHWSELKAADHRCAYCINKRRCEGWLSGRRLDDAPRMFCPNATTIARWFGGYLQCDVRAVGADGEAILESGLARTRELLKRIRSQGPSPSERC